MYGSLGEKEIENVDITVSFLIVFVRKKSRCMTLSDLYQIYRIFITIYIVYIKIYRMYTNIYIIYVYSKIYKNISH